MGLPGGRLGSSPASCWPLADLGWSRQGPGEAPFLVVVASRRTGPAGRAGLPGGPVGWSSRACDCGACLWPCVVSEGVGADAGSELGGRVGPRSRQTAGGALESTRECSPGSWGSPESRVEAPGWALPARQHSWGSSRVCDAVSQPGWTHPSSVRLTGPYSWLPSPSLGSSRPCWLLSPAARPAAH